MLCTWRVVRGWAWCRYNAEEGDSGRWFTGLGQKFIEFPRNLQRMRFNAEEGSNGPTITAKTFNGTSVELDMAFQYGLSRTAEDVSALYLTYGTDYARFFAKVRATRCVGAPP